MEMLQPRFSGSESDGGSTRVVDGAGFLSFCSPWISGFYGLWDAKRNGARMPARSRFDIAELKPWLGWIAMFDVMHEALADGHDFKYRLVGSNFVRHHGRDPTGRRVSESALTNDRQLTLDNLRAICASGAPRYRDDPVQCVDLRTYTPPRLYLPLSDDGEVVDIVMMLGSSPLDERGRIVAAAGGVSL
jgi:hypothetical protein